MILILSVFYSLVISILVYVCRMLRGKTQKAEDGSAVKPGKDIWPIIAFVFIGMLIVGWIFYRLAPGYAVGGLTAITAAAAIYISTIIAKLKKTSGK